MKKFLKLNNYINKKNIDKYDSKIELARDIRRKLNILNENKIFLLKRKIRDLEEK